MISSFLEQTTEGICVFLFRNKGVGETDLLVTDCIIDFKKKKRSSLSIQKTLV